MDIYFDAHFILLARSGKAKASHFLSFFFFTQFLLLKSQERYIPINWSMTGADLTLIDDIGDPPPWD